MESSALYQQLRSQIEENWRLMNPTVVENQLQLLREVERITDNEFQALMQFFDERVQTGH